MTDMCETIIRCEISNDGKPFKCFGIDSEGDVTHQESALTLVQMDYEEGVDMRVMAIDGKTLVEFQGRHDCTPFSRAMATARIEGGRARAIREMSRAMKGKTLEERKKIMREGKFYD